MVELVLRNPRRQPLELEPLLLVVRIARLDRHPQMPLDRDHDALERETALVVRNTLV